MKRRRPKPEDFTIGWICPLALEYAAAKSVLDELYDEAEYATGRIHHHDIVITCLPAGQMGTNAAAAATERMRAAFPSLKHALLVGIAGGVPSDKADIRLGDVVVSQPDGQYGGVVQYDFGKTLPGGFQRVGYLNGPSHDLLAAVSRFKANLVAETKKIRMRILNLLPSANDILFQPSYDHVGGNDCAGCRKDMLVPRATRDETTGIFFGTIASGNQVIKDGVTRDRSSSKLGGVLCFEMEAAGVVNLMPCLVIRGICDYADSHKNKVFQPFAAAAAATCAREILLYLPRALCARLDNGQTPGYGKVQLEAQDRQELSMDQCALKAPVPRLSIIERQMYTEFLKFEELETRHESIRTAHIKTCQWLLRTEEYKKWLDEDHFDQHRGFLWIKGKPGAGKSTLMKSIVKQATCNMPGVTVLWFFFNARGEILEKTIIGMYRSLLYQLLNILPDLQIVFETLPMTPTKDRPPDWHTETLKTLLYTAAKRLQDRPVVCYIDALDECDEKQVRDMLSFFEQLGDQASSHQVRFFVCFSSRHYPHVTTENKIELVLEDQDGHQQDIANYVHSELKIGHSKQAQQIKEEVINRASGIFLWVVLVVQILTKEFDCGRVHALHRRLREIPDGLNSLLKDILTRDNHNMNATLLCLQWILYARRPLTREELYFAILAGTEPDSEFLAGWTAGHIPEDALYRFVLNCSKGLAEQSKSKTAPKMQFIHESVRDFLRDEGLADLKLGNIAPGHSHEALKLCCLNYVNIDLFDLPQSEDLPEIKAERARALKSLSQHYPFLQYAVENVFYHANEASKRGISQVPFLTNFPTSRWILRNNLFENHKIRRYTPAADKLYILANNDLAALVADELSIGSLPAVSAERYRHPVGAAVMKQNEEITRMLLASDMPFKSLLKIPRIDGTPLLFSAIRLESFNIFAQLVNFGIDPNSKDRSRGRTALHFAILFKKLPVIELLIAAGAEPDARDGEGLTPLHYCVMEPWTTESPTIAQTLLDAGADLESRDNWGRTPLKFAIDCRAIDSIRFLVDKGACLESRNSSEEDLIVYSAIGDASTNDN
ncbi:hypothetical protein BDW67DRAFT_81078 [Aspergillus spinulosporus]